MTLQEYQKGLLEEKKQEYKKLPKEMLTELIDRLNIELLFAEEELKKRATSK